MSEPEDVLLEGAHLATGFVAALWSRRRAEPERVALAEVRPRLELLVAALYGESPPITVAEPPARPTLFGRWARGIPRHLVELRPLASTDGTRLRLPRSLEAAEGEDAAFREYRLLAVQQAARLRRGTPALLPEIGENRLVRDLYLLAEAAAVDREIAAELPGWVPQLCAARAASLAGRIEQKKLTAPEREVDRLIRRLLAAHPAEIPPELAIEGGAAPIPAESLAWARGRAAELAALEGRYRGVPAVALWGRVEAPGAEAVVHGRGAPGDTEPKPPAPERVRTLQRRPRVRQEKDDEDDAQMGMWMIQIDDPQEHVEDPMGLQRPTDRDEEADADDLADSLSELPEARLVPVPGSPSEVLASDDPPERQAEWHDGVQRHVGVAYPEWDWRIEAYHAGRAIVRLSEAPLGNAAWADAVLRRHAREVEQVRRRFERLRPRRVRLGRQPDGADVDLGAYVTAYADQCAGGAVDDRLYEAVRPERRDLAISLLVDVSGSTDSWIAGERRIVDVEKEALLLVCEALDALGDRYNVLAFSGEGPESISVQTVKGFTERNGSAVRRRIAALEPDRYTRLGAALRHATALLCREAAGHRLLLVLSDGKPNDVDLYEGRYGIEDARQAVAEARLQAVHPFCLTVDRHAPTYLPRIFGAGGYSVLRHAERLPQVLVEVVRGLLKR
jgi:nitric oxide reductase NorD protein